MKIKLVFFGKQKSGSVDDLIQEYIKRSNKYISCDVTYLLTNDKDPIKRKKKEFSKFSDLINKDDRVYLLDEKGKQYDSLTLSTKLTHCIDSGVKRIILVVGGAYGFSEEMYKSSNELIALSKLTLTHEIARLLISEQIYRSITIINNHPYHHE